MRRLRIKCNQYDYVCQASAARRAARGPRRDRGRRPRAVSSRPARRAHRAAGVSRAKPSAKCICSAAPQLNLFLLAVSDRSSYVRIAILAIGRVHMFDLAHWTLRLRNQVKTLIGNAADSRSLALPHLAMAGNPLAPWSPSVEFLCVLKGSLHDSETAQARVWTRN